MESLCISGASPTSHRLRIHSEVRSAAPHDAQQCGEQLRFAARRCQLSRSALTSSSSGRKIAAWGTASTSFPRKTITIRCSVQSESLVVQYSSMKETYEDLAQKLLPVALEKAKSDDKYLIGIAGPPGAGKSTLAKEVAASLNNLYRERTAFEKASIGGDIAIAVPMDGFHLYKSQLDAMEDPVEAHARRGAPWTFNPAGLLVCLKTLRSKDWALFPSFDHGVGDPVEQDIEVSTKHKIVLVEGNYLFLDDDNWKKIAEMFDERWFISVDLDLAMQRVERRHISTGKSKEIAVERIAYNDRPNGELIQQTMNRADVIIHSVDHSLKL